MNYFNYFSEIEELFIRRRGRNLLLSPLDWALIESWQERAVPLHIILRGIEKIFDNADRQPDKKRAVKSLLYCKEEIEAQYAEWLERQVGKNKIPDSEFQIPDSGNGASEPKGETADSSKSALFSDDALRSHLERISAEINLVQNEAADDFKTTLEKVSDRLAELARQQSHTAENLEAALENLDAMLDASLLRNFETEELKIKVGKQIASYKNKMEREVYERTFDLMLLKRLREQLSVPRLSLFYL